MTALTDYYIQCLEAATGRRTDREAFDQLFDYVAIQRCLKATGTFAAMAVVRQRPQYLPYIPPTLAYLQPLLRRCDVLQPLTRGHIAPAGSTILAGAFFFTPSLSGNPLASRR